MAHEVKDPLQAELAAWGDAQRPAPAPLAASTDSDALWRRGQRRRAAMRTGATVMALAVLATGVLGVNRAPPDVLPAATGPAQVPDELFDVPSRAADLAPQPLVGLTIAERSTWRGTRVLAAGISAATGEYGFLDPEGLVGLPVLSPDGSQVAWWSSLTDDSSPDATSPLPKDPAVTVRGVKVLDLETGRTLTHEEEHRHGVEPQQMAWWGAEPTLVFSSIPLTEDGGADLDHGYRTSVWEPGSTVEPWPWTEGEVLADPGTRVEADVQLDDDTDLTPVRPFTGARQGHYVTSGGGQSDGLLVVDPTRRSVHDVDAGTTAVTQIGASSLVWGEDGRLAAMSYPGDVEGTGPVRLFVGHLDVPVDDDSTAVLREVPSAARQGQVLGWRGNDVLVHDFSADDALYLSVDPGTGSTSRLTRHRDAHRDEEGVHRVTWQLADHVLGTAPVVDASAPRNPRDPRVLLGASGAGLLVLLAGLGWWWRRGRP